MTAAEERYARLLLDARRRWLRAKSDIGQLRERVMCEPGNDIARRRWLDALARLAVEQEALDRLDDVIAISDELRAELAEVTS